MGFFKWLLLAVVALALLAVLAGQFGLLRGRPPHDLGARDGRLKAPSATPNSATSQADLWPDHPQRQYARVEPLALRPGGGAATMAALQAIVAAMPGATVVGVGDDYLRAEFTTRLMKYTDDVEFWLDRNAGVVQVRSASRLGRRDLGVNRERIERIRVALAAAPGG